MPRKPAIAIVTVVLMASLGAPTSAGAVSGPPAYDGGYGVNLGHHHGTAGAYRAARRSYGLGVLPRSGFAGTSHAYTGLGQQGSGWHQGGFGGTLNPGWGYNFGPQLGGIGH